MRKLFLIALTVTLLPTSAVAAPKAVPVKPLEIVASGISAEGLLAAGKNLVTYVNTGSINSNVVVTGLDATGIQQWVTTIDSGVDEIVTAATVDAAGTIWLAGSSALVAPSDTQTAVVAAENPDGVVAEALPQIRPDMNQITIWKLTPLGELVGTYSLMQNSPALVSALSVNSSGISLVGSLAGRSFLLSADSAGILVSRYLLAQVRQHSTLLCVAQMAQSISLVKVQRLLVERSWPEREMAY